MHGISQQLAGKAKAEARAEGLVTDFVMEFANVGIAMGKCAEKVSLSVPHFPLEFLLDLPSAS